MPIQPKVHKQNESDMRVSLIGGRAARWTPLKLASMSNSKNVILLNYALLTILVSCSFNFFSVSPFFS